MSNYNTARDEEIEVRCKFETERDVIEYRNIVTDSNWRGTPYIALDAANITVAHAMVIEYLRPRRGWFDGGPIDVSQPDDLERMRETVAKEAREAERARCVAVATSIINTWILGRVAETGSVSSLLPPQRARNDYIAAGQIIKRALLEEE